MLKSTIAILAIEKSIFPKLESGTHVNVLISASVCACDQRYPVGLADT